MGSGFSCSVVSEPYTDWIIGLEVIASLTMSLMSDSADDEVPARPKPLPAPPLLPAPVPSDIFDRFAALRGLNDSEGCGSGAIAIRRSCKEEEAADMAWLAGDTLA